MQNWMRRLTHDGVVFYPPEGRAAAWLRVYERLRPIKSLRELRASQLSGLGLPDAKLDDVKRVVTNEGEHGATYTITSAAEKLTISYGVVYGDDFFTVLEGVAVAPELAENLVHTTGALVRSMPLFLGKLRRRRYAYTPPAGWQAVVKEHSVSWYPMDFPKNRAVIRVFDAVPARDTPGTVLTRRLFDDPQSELTAVTDTSMFAVLTDTGLSGVTEVTRGSWSDGSPSAMIRVTLNDTSYAYNMRLETSEPSITAASKVFEAVIRSVEPVPTAPGSENAGRLIHWAE